MAAQKGKKCLLWLFNSIHADVLVAMGAEPLLFFLHYGLEHLCDYPYDVFLGSYSSGVKLHVRKVLWQSFVIWGLLAKEMGKHNFGEMKRNKPR